MPGNIHSFWPTKPTELAAAALVLIAFLFYLLGLDSHFAPTNGDEMVYIHIARMTAESGNWLPLQSEIIGTRNTKPPLLFWQAMVAGQWGQQWSLVALRLPSIFYTFATAAILGFFTLKISGQRGVAWLSVALYLLFFSTFRYGRVYLTSAPETFWLALPLWWVLWIRVRQSAEPSLPPITLGLRAYTLFGIAFGLGAAYKSFALIAPAAATVWCAVLLSAPRFDWRNTLRTTLGVTWSAAIGLAIFALWFALDPDPGAVWQEFILAENAGKMTNTQGYWHAALWGAYPMWTQLLAYPENAGLLFFVALGLIWAGAPFAFKTQTYRQMAPPQRILLVWLVVWLVVFTLPSQRSARYVIPAMPALAMVMALGWEKMGRFWFWITLLITLPALLMLGRIGWSMGSLGIASSAQVAIVLIAACAGAACAGVGFISKNRSKTATLGSVLAVYATFTLMVAPLGDTEANYPASVQSALEGKRVTVPNGFTGQFERFHFFLPRAQITPYDAEGRNTGALKPELDRPERLSYLLDVFDAVVWLQDTPEEAGPSCLPQCTVLGSRWHVKSRHKSGEITLENLWHPEQWLFRKEWLVSRGFASERDKLGL